MLEKKKVKIYLPVCLLAFLLIGLPAGYVYMVEYDMRNARCITLIHNQSDYTMPLQLNPFIPYKAVISQIGHGEYVDKLPFKLLAQAETDAFMELKERKDVLWTYLSPPLDFKADGVWTGTYKCAGKELPFNAKGESTISYADYAIAMIDEVENEKFIQDNFSVVSV